VVALPDASASGTLPNAQSNITENTCIVFKLTLRQIYDIVRSTSQIIDILQPRT
jgi:hypothetical protein